MSTCAIERRQAARPFTDRAINATAFLLSDKLTEFVDDRIPTEDFRPERDFCRHFLLEFINFLRTSLLLTDFLVVK